jgi:F-type H+-transporting ATPase subunit gamma
MRNRIGSVKSTQKITKALNMVAAAKLKRAQDQAESARPYARKMAAVIANLAAGVSGDGAPKLLAGTGSDKKHLIVVATGDKGLAGGFNTNVIRAARERINGLIAAGKDVRIIAVGRKSRDGLTRLYGDRLVKTFEMSDHKVVGLPAAEPVAALIAEEFEAGNADVVTLFFSRFQSVIAQVPTPKQLIPAVVDGGAGASGTGVGGAFSSAISASHLRIHRFSSRPSPLSSSALANAARAASYSPSANDACPLRWKALGVASSLTESVASETASV